MARSFVATSSQLLYRDSAVLAAAPITMACWFYPLNVTGIHTLLAIVDENQGINGDYHLLSARGDQTGDPVWAHSFNSDQGASAHADSTAAFVASSWQHACAVFAGATDRRVYLNGGNKGTNVTSRSPALLSHTSIGGLYRSDNPAQYATAYIAEAAMWDVALTDDDVATLAKGICPKLVRPQNLVAYWPLIASDIDPVGRYEMTAAGSPTFVAHPRVFYSRPPVVGFGTAAPPVVATARSQVIWI